MTVMIDKDNLKAYLEKEWRYNNHPKYYKYFEVWFENLLPQQLYFFEVAWMSGKMGV